MPKPKPFRPRETPSRIRRREFLEEIPPPEGDEPSLVPLGFNFRLTGRPRRTQSSAWPPEEEGDALTLFDDCDRLVDRSDRNSTRIEDAESAQEWSGLDLVLREAWVEDAIEEEEGVLPPCLVVASMPGMRPMNGFAIQAAGNCECHKDDQVSDRDRPSSELDHLQQSVEPPPDPLARIRRIRSESIPIEPDRAQVLGLAFIADAPLPTIDAPAQEFRQEARLSTNGHRLRVKVQDGDPIFA